MIRTVFLLLSLILIGPQLFSQVTDSITAPKDTVEHLIIRQQDESKGWIKSTDSKRTARKKSHFKDQEEMTEFYERRYIPRKASLYAAICPGAGQIYNKKYWKLPLVYGGIGATAYGLNFYQGQYDLLKKQLFEVLETGQNSVNPQITDENIIRPAIDLARRQRDLLILVMAGVYVLQIVDAHIDAHLKEFDVNPNLQVRVTPSISNDPAIGQQAGMSITFKF